MTDETKHTPGPWSISAFNNHTVIAVHEGANDAGHVGVDGRHQHQIADMSEFMVDTSLEERKANARLIAAAPELLEALKDARFALYGNGPGNPKIDAAIAKAEGRSK